MSRTSVIATHKRREEIEKDIIKGMMTTRAISAKYKVSLQAIHNYKKIIGDQARAELERRGALTIDYLKETEALRQIALRQLEEVLRRKELPLPIRVGMLATALRSAGEFTDRLTRYTGQSKEKTGDTNIQVNLFAMMPIVKATLMMYPEALEAVERAMREAMNGNGRNP